MWNILMWLFFSSLSEAAHDPYSLYRNICFTTADSHCETKLRHGKTLYSWAILTINGGDCGKWESEKPKQQLQ